MDEGDVRYKLYISDILRMTKHSDLPYYLLGNLLVKKVDILGFVSDKIILPNYRFVYKVDDGTGVIDCYYNSSNGHCQEAFPLEDNKLKNGTKVLMKHMKKIISSKMDLSFGNIAHIQGCVKEFRCKKEIYVEDMRLVTNMNEEIHRVFELEALYRGIYGISQE